MLNFNFLSGLMFVIGIGFTGMFLYAVKNQKNKLAIVFSLMCLGMGIFSIGYGMELLVNDLNQGILALKVQYFGLGFLSVLWFILIFKFHKKQYPKYHITLFISIIPIATIFLIMTNELHNYYYKTIELLPYKNYFILQTQKTPMYYVFIINSYIILCYGLYGFFTTWKNSKDNLKIQSLLMLIGTIWPTLTNIIYLFGITPANFDPTPIGFFLMSIFFFIAIFKYDYLDLNGTIRNVAFDHIEEGILVIDNHNRIIDVNTSAEKTFPWMGKKNIGNNLSAYEIGEEILKNKNNCFNINLTMCNKNKCYEFRTTPITEFGNKIGNIYIFQDITHQKDLITDLSYLATHDFLTSINNRMSFFKLAEIELYNTKRYNIPLTILMLDIDFFKKINDTYGHFIGDEVLKSITKITQFRLRTSDIFARFGGDEFIILLPEISEENSLKVAEDIRKIIAKAPLAINGLIIPITVSIGLVHYNESMINLSLEQIIDFSDQVLYEAKKIGRNKVSSYNDFIKKDPVIIT